MGKGKGCCGTSKDQEGALAQEAIVDPSNRKCRDVLCLMLFLCFLVGMLIVGIFSFTQGVPDRIFYGIDKHGYVCGHDNSGEEPQKETGANFEDRPFLYYLNPLQFIGEDPFGYRFANTICVDRCPGDGGWDAGAATGVCQASDYTASSICDDPGQHFCEYYHHADVLFEPLMGAVPELDPDQDKFNTTYFGQLPSVADDSPLCAELETMYPVLTDDLRAQVDNVCGAGLQLASVFPHIGYGPCYPILANATPIYSRCFPKLPSSLDDAGLFSYNSGSASGAATGFLVSQVSVDGIKGAMEDAFTDGTGRLDRYVGDLGRGYAIVLVAGLVCGVLFSLFWMVVLRYAAGIMAWLAILLLNLGMIACTILAYNKAGYLGAWGAVGDYIASRLGEFDDAFDPSEEDRKIWLGWAIVLTVITVVVLLLTLLMLRRIKVAVACLKVASAAVAKMPTILLFPLAPFLVYCCFVAYWVLVSGYLYSAGDIVEERREPDVYDFYSLEQLYQDSTSGGPQLPPNFNVTAPSGTPCGQDPDCRFSVSWDSTLKYAILYHIFGLLWINQFIIGFTYVVIAGAIAQYYWNRGDANKMPRHPVWLGIKNAATYHCGSIALGAFIVAVVQFVRLLLEYLDKKTKEMQKGNAAAKWCMCCLKYCLWYLEKIIKFINRNAYIIVAVKGTGYCTSAFRAVKLIINNALRLAAVNIVGDLLIFLGKMAVTTGCGIVAFLMSDLSYYTDPARDKYLTSPLLPIAVAVLVGFIVTSLFFAVYEMAVDTILLSFCEDCESSPSGEARHAPPKLAETLSKAGKAANKEYGEKLMANQSQFQTK